MDKEKIEGVRDQEEEKRSVSSSPRKQNSEEAASGKSRSKSKRKADHDKKSKKKKKRKKSDSKKESPQLRTGREPVQLSKHLHGDDSKYSSITGSKIKLKVDKTKSDKEDDQKRRTLLDFLNSSYE